MTNALAFLQYLASCTRTDVYAAFNKSTKNRYTATNQPIETSTIYRHIRGTAPIAVYPLNGNLTRVAVFDFDNHQGELSWRATIDSVRRVVTHLRADGMLPHNFRSGGGNGAHIWLVWDEPQQVQQVRDYCKSVLGRAGMKSGAEGVAKGQVEIFPKQDLARKGYGNAIALPLARKSVPLNADLEITDVGTWQPPDENHFHSPAPPKVPISAELLVPPTSERPDPDELANALQFVSADAYDVWIKVALALKHEFGDDGLEVWLDWSSSSNKFPGPEKRAEVWDTLTPRGEITVGTVLHLARESGWLGKGKDPFHFDFGRHKAPRASLSNAKSAIQRMGMRCWYDVFKRRRFVQGFPAPDQASQITDDIEIMVRDEILKLYGFDPGPDHVHSGLKALCLSNQVNSMCDYFDGLAWDGKSRLDNMLSKYFGAENTAFNHSAGSKFMIAAVRRSRLPGTKFDTALILEGPQGSGKSEALRILAGDENFSDQGILAMDERAQAEQLQGILIFELSELEGMHKADVTKVKSFLSRSCDRTRMAYARNREDQPRTCVFVGTTNESKYLKDPTGNRRFWPVRTGKIDLVALARDRDQLWAEAAQREGEQESILLDEELYEVAAQLQEERVEDDPWLEVLREVKGTECNGVHRVTTQALIQDVLRLDMASAHSGHSKRLGPLMRQLGWEGPTTIYVAGARAKGYTRPK